MLFQTLKNIENNPVHAWNTVMIPVIRICLSLVQRWKVKTKIYCACSPSGILAHGNFQELRRIECHIHRYIKVTVSYLSISQWEFQDQKRLAVKFLFISPRHCLKRRFSMHKKKKRKNNHLSSALITKERMPEPSSAE